MNSSASDQDYDHTRRPAIVKCDCHGVYIKLNTFRAFPPGQRVIHTDNQRKNKLERMRLHPFTVYVGDLMGTFKTYYRGKVRR